jgi:hypothetical protein
VQTGALGLGLHFLIATAAALVYYFVSRFILGLTRCSFIFGPLYGVAVYVVMNFVVIPLSALPKRTVPLDLAAIVIVVHMVCVELPIALAARRYGGMARQ